MPTLIYGILFVHVPWIIFPGNMKTLAMMLGVIFLTTYILPMICSILIFRVSKLKQLEFPEKQERVNSLLYISILYSFNLYLFARQFSFNEPVFLIMLGINISVILSAILSVFFRLSLHATGAGGMVGMIILFSYKYPMFNMLYPMMLVVILAGIILSSRLALQAHNLREILYGFGIGILGSFTLVF